MTEKPSDENLRDLGLDRASIQESMEKAVASLKKKYGEEEFERMIAQAAANLSKTFPGNPIKPSKEELNAMAKWCLEGDDWIHEAGVILIKASDNVDDSKKNNKS